MKKWMLWVLFFVILLVGGGITITFPCSQKLQALGSLGSLVGGLAIVFAAASYISQLSEISRSRKVAIQQQYLQILKTATEFFGENNKIPSGHTPEEEGLRGSLFMRGHVSLVQIEIFLQECTGTDLLEKSIKEDMLDTVRRSVEGTLAVLNLLYPEQSEFKLDTFPNIRQLLSRS